MTIFVSHGKPAGLCEHSCAGFLGIKVFVQAPSDVPPKRLVLLQLETSSRTTSADAVSEGARPFRGRRLSGAEFEALAGRQRAAVANDNEDTKREAA